MLYPLSPVCFVLYTESASFFRTCQALPQLHSQIPFCTVKTATKHFSCLSASCFPRYYARFGGSYTGCASNANCEPLLVILCRARKGKALLFQVCACTASKAFREDRSVTNRPKFSGSNSSSVERF